MEQPRAGVHYPRSTGEFQAWFRIDEDCLDYLEWLRWPGGFTCPSCGHAGGWRRGDGRLECAACRGRTSVTAGTIFDRTRTPLTVWFTACWLFATQKDGISAQHLQRSLAIGSYRPRGRCCTGCGRCWSARAGRLAGTVQVDETFIGGDEPGLRGGRARGKKVLTGIAVEVPGPQGIGRCRMAVLADGSAESLHPFVTGAVEPGATVITDAWMGYHGLDAKGYVHERRSQAAARARGDDPGQLLPAVHRVASLAKRWLLGTHQGSVGEAHLPAYLDEFTFRFNRRRPASRGMVFYRVLELAAGHDPVRFQDLLTGKKPRPAPVARGWGHPPSLDRPAANRPWRTGELQLQLPIPLRLSEYPRPQLSRNQVTGRWRQPRVVSHGWPRAGSIRLARAAVSRPCRGVRPGPVSPAEGDVHLMGRANAGGVGNGSWPVAAA
jgi:transposase-like protein